ncbi:hypothetical protein HK100_004443 [Physocladia obscura]|uniref:AGC-kinase C-terminal domain-containing protein n=1 Tax=Physocladia obscura TaxID=109957 RepID=A0AAD5SUE4_9FUNG|nr:hypothetical protein HK100_004443 [Physocladia obscura]
MLDRDPATRLGTNGAQEIKQHDFFADINWQKLNARKYKPAFRPQVANSQDTSNFDEEFTSEKPQDSFVDDSSHLTCLDNQFEGFSYRGDPMGSIQVGSLMNRVTASGGEFGVASLPKFGTNGGGSSLRPTRRWDNHE